MHMDDLLDELKARASALHQQAKDGDEVVPLQHCLSVVARELGFSGWPHLTAVLSGQELEDFGALMYPPRCSAHFNIWSASYDEAQGIRAEHGGWLLPYKHQFLIVDRHFIDTLGLDPDDPAWDEMGRDWVRPVNVDARARLCEQLVRARLAQS